MSSIVNNNDSSEILTKVKEIMTSLPHKEIESVQFKFLTSNRIDRLAVMEVKKPFTPDQKKQVYNPEASETCDDARMGVLYPDRLCQTCDQPAGKEGCPGHYGKISFAGPIVVPRANVVKTIVNVLNIFCSCGRCYLDDEYFEKSSLESAKKDPLEKKTETIGEVIMEKFKMRNVSARLKALATELEPHLGKLKTHKSCKCANIGHHDGCEPPLKYVNTAGRNKPKENMHQKRPPSVYIKGGQDEPNTIASPDKIKVILDNINRRNQGKGNWLSRLGLNIDVTSFIIDKIIVVPPCARPFRVGSGKLSMDPLTAAYDELLAAMVNNRANPTSQAALADVALRVKKIFEIIKEKLKSKKGLVRGNLMGKRTDFTERTVIGPGNHLNYGEFGMPKIVAEYFTKDITITSFNIGHFQELFARADKSILYVKPRKGRYNGKMYPVKANSYAIRPLKVGDILVRRGKDGDFVLAGRQPSLSFASMMAHRARFHKNKNNLLPSQNTPGYNADFDGDEMHSQCPQSVESIVEAKYIMNTETNLMDKRTSRPLAGLVYNTLSSMYLMTKSAEICDPVHVKKIMRQLASDVFVAPVESKIVSSSSMLGWAINHYKSDTVEARVDALMYKLGSRAPGFKLSGKKLFSLLLPPDAYYVKDKVKIINGQLVSGVITKAHIGPSSGSIIHYLYKKYGAKRTSRFLTEGQKLGDWFLEYHGLSIGFSDCFETDPHLAQEIDRIIKENFASIRSKVFMLKTTNCDYGKSTRPDFYNPLPEESEESERKEREESKEEDINFSPVNKLTETEIQIEKKKHISYLDNGILIGTRITELAIAKTSPLLTMNDSGAKGSKVNIASLKASVGECFVKGNLPETAITGGTRVLQCFDPNSDEIECHGYIKSSFTTGLNEAEFYAHMLGTREGVVNTGTGTAVVGAEHRSLTKAVEDVKIDDFGGVSDGKRIQSLVFGDGFNTAEIIETKTYSSGSLYSFIDIESLINELNTNA